MRRESWSVSDSKVALLWRLGALGELPRDMHCCHEPQEPGATTLGGIAQCPECRLVLEVIKAARSERPS